MQNSWAAVATVFSLRNVKKERKVQLNLSIKTFVIHSSSLELHYKWGNGGKVSVLALDKMV